LLLLLLNLAVNSRLHSPLLVPCPCFVIRLLLTALLRCTSDGALLLPD
jgi:hypothetical protein